MAARRRFAEAMPTSRAEASSASQWKRRNWTAITVIDVSDDQWVLHHEEWWDKASHQEKCVL